MPFPNNPTGAIMTREELEPIAEVVKEHDLYVISDEIYGELTYKGRTYFDSIATGYGRENIGYQWLLQRICHDRMETWLCMRTTDHYGSDAEDPSVCDHVCTDQQPVCSSGRHCATVGMK